MGLSASGVYRRDLESWDTATMSAATARHTKEQGTAGALGVKWHEELKGVPSAIEFLKLSSADW